MPPATTSLLTNRLRVTSSLVNQTKQIAVMHCRIEDAKTGRVYATGFHTKVSERLQVSVAWLN